MTTASTIIFDALAEIGVVGSADQVPAEDSALCLRKLNQIVQTISNKRLMIPTLTEISISLTSLQSYLVGPNGATVTARPIKVVSASAIDSQGLETPVHVITREEWDSIGKKDLTGGPPDVVFYEALSTNGRAWVYPKAPGYTLKLDCHVLLTSFAPSTDVTLPEGYEAYFTLALADAIASSFGKQTSPDTIRRLRAATSAIKATNAEPLYLDTGLDAREEYRIERGY